MLHRGSTSVVGIKTKGKRADTFFLIFLYPWLGASCDRQADHLDLAIGFPELADLFFGGGVDGVVTPIPGQDAPFQTFGFVLRKGSHPIAAGLLAADRRWGEACRS